MTTLPPILSIVTPVLNGGRYADTCFASVKRLAQVCPGMIEHIVADGGSTDGTLAKAQAALDSEGSPVSLVLEGPDRGQSHAINRGCAHARGEWLAWLNADDAYETQAANILAALAEGEHADADVVVGRCRFVDETGWVVFEPRPPALDDPAALLSPLSQWFAGRCIVQPEAFIRREAFERVGGLDEQNHLAMDHDLWLRLLEAGARFVTVEMPVAVQYVHPEQKTADNLGVARQIVANCERYLCDNPSPSQRCVDEIEILRNRIRDVEHVMRSCRGPVPVQGGVVADSLCAAIRALPVCSGDVLVVGEAAYRAVRTAGWDSSRITRASRSLLVDGIFDVVVVDWSSLDRSSVTFLDLMRALRAGGMLILGACSVEADVMRMRHTIEHALGDRVTWAGKPWSDELLVAARHLLVWFASRAHIDGGMLAKLDVVERIPAALARPQTDALRAFGLESSRVVATLVCRRPG